MVVDHICCMHKFLSKLNNYSIDFLLLVLSVQHAMIHYLVISNDMLHVSAADEEQGILTTSRNLTAGRNLTTLSYFQLLQI